MKRTFRYLVVAFYVVATISWATTAIGLFADVAAGRPVTPDRMEAFNLGLASVVTAVWLGAYVPTAWRRARRRRKVAGRIHVVVSVDTSEFDKAMRDAQRATDRLTRRPKTEGTR